MRLIFLGGPGSGKGTQAKKLVEKYGLTHISTGDLLRKAMKEGTELGKTAKEYVDAGDLVPDDVILGMIKERLIEIEGGFIFDGFPRTLEQSKGLESILNELNIDIDKVVNLNVDDQMIVDRLSARRMCRTCGFEYNLKTRRPKKEGVCDIDGGELYQRSDDNEETIKNRLSLYHRNTEPIEDFYRETSKLVEIDGSGSFDEVFKSITESVGKG
ncbi:MAG: adenylate kinase [Candidatus Zixiibacteriota bacterium]|nr:MAG: adenylate kinase [candidate division Zixibacteria bacterium]